MAAGTGTDGTGRIGILVLGMHRSGTSLLAQSLVQLGAAAPRTPIGASANNEGGYGESRLVQGLNDTLLTGAGTGWDDWQTPGTLPDDALSRATEVLGQDFGTAPLFVLKEPRICRLAPLWIAALERAGIAPRVILALRNPLEVAASLGRRDAIEPVLSHLMWLSHMLEAEAATRGLPRVVTDYDSLLTEGPAVLVHVGRALGIDWPQTPGTGPTLARDGLRHHRHDAEDLARTPDLPQALAQRLARVHTILSRWVQAGEDPADHAELDTLLAQLREDGRIHGPLIALGRKRAVALQAAGRRIATLETACHRAEAERDRLSAERDRLAAEAAALRGAASGPGGPVPDDVTADLRAALDRAMTEQRRADEAQGALVRSHEAERAARAAEIARLGGMLLHSETALQDTRRARDRMLADTVGILQALRQAEARLLWLPARLRQGRLLRALMATGRFDPDFYLRRNADVAATGADPGRHYLIHGLAEGRPPNAACIPETDPVSAEDAR